MLELPFDQSTGLEPLAVDSARPIPSRIHLHQVILARLERLQFGSIVFIDFDRDSFEIVRTALHVEAFSPIVWVAYKRNVFTETGSLKLNQFRRKP